MARQEPSAQLASPEVERALLAAISVAPKYAYLLSDLHAEAFADARHREIWKALRALTESGRLERDAVGTDLTLLADELRSRNKLDFVGGLAFLVQLDESIPDLGHIDEYVSTLRERHLRRVAHDECSATMRRLANVGTEDAGAICRKLRQSILDAEQAAVVDGFQEWGAVLRSVTAEVSEKKPGSTSGLSTGYGDIDRVTQGFVPGQNIVIAGRPGMGKTSLALNIAYDCAVQRGKSVAVFSLEMGKDELVLRMISSATGISHGKLRGGYMHEMDRMKVKQHADLFADAPLYICDQGSVTPSLIAAQCGRLKDGKGLDLVVVDYLQIVTPERYRDNRTTEVTDTSRMLKNMARDLGVPVIVLSQLSRESEKQGRRPRLSDLRESGAIEQDADIVAFLHRTGDEQSVVDLLIAKHRSGPTADIQLRWTKETMRFDSMRRE